MECFICNNQMEFFLEKNFDSKYNLDKVIYLKCVNCGFVSSKTHYEMSLSEWENLNEIYHSNYQGKNFNQDDPNWITRLESQAHIINFLYKNNFLSNNNPWLDWGCGDGKLSDILLEKDLHLLNFDPYMNKDKNYLSESDLNKNKFDFVINTSVFEHVRDIETLNNIENLVSNNGVFGIHTLVCEEIPKDPNWFYLLPVHCSFYTNKSMQILFEKWKYQSSIYNVESKLWLWFKDDNKFIQDATNNINSFLENKLLYYKKGFMDYWK